MTGGGRGLGRAYADHFLALGATVVVNDLDAIEGVTHAGDVSDSAFADALIATAVDAYGRVDALVNNAGIIRWAGLPDVDWSNIQAHIDVHVGGTFNTIKAAWPHMVAASYGRIVNTTSAGVFGLAANIGYATAKGAVIGLTRSTAVAGAEHNIKINAIAPAAATRMGGDVDDKRMVPELVAPMVALLASDECPVTGEIYTAGGGRFARLFLASTEGAVTDDPAAHWNAVNDETQYWVPQDLMDWSRNYLKHQQ